MNENQPYKDYPIYKKLISDLYSHSILVHKPEVVQVICIKPDSPYTLLRKYWILCCHGMDFDKIPQDYYFFFESPTYGFWIHKEQFKYHFKTLQ